MSALITVHIAVDKECGHVHAGSVIGTQVERWAEQASLSGYPLKLSATSVEPDQVDDACAPSGLGHCERCQLRRDAVMHVLFREQIILEAEAQGYDPFVAVNRYEMLSKEHPRMPHSTIAKAVVNALGVRREMATAVDFEAIRPEDFQR